MTVERPPSVRRAPLARLTALALLSWGLAAVGSATATAAPGGPPRAALRAVACHPALNPTEREMSVAAVMRPLPGTRAMTMRFDLLTRRPSHPQATELHFGDLGHWLSPTDPPTLGQRPGDVWVLSKSVVDLPTPARYRLRVTFRWTGRAGKVLGTAVRVSEPCQQPELRPDVAVSEIDVAPVADDPGQSRYSVTLVNLGASDTGPFNVAFRPGGAAMTEALSGVSLEPQEEQVLSFTGPTCTQDASPVVIADPEHAVDDLNPANNSLQVRADCPATTLADRG